MRIENKIYYYFEQIEKIAFNIFLLKSNISMKQFAKLCGISMAYLSLIVNGRRAITKSLIEKFAENGFKVEI